VKLWAPVRFPGCDPIARKGGDVPRPTVLVTGGAGYIGSHIVWALHDRQTPVVVIDDLSTGDRRLLPDSVPLLVADASDGAAVGDFIAQYRIEAVIHAAGSIVVSESVSDPLAYYRNNVEVSRSLIAACVASGIDRFVFSSSAAVYGEPATLPLAETAALRPINPYGRTKLIVEWMLQDAAAAHGLKAVSLRYFNAAGADPAGRSGQSTPRATHLIKVAAQLATGQRSAMTVMGTDYQTRDGTCERDYIHVTDLARAHLDTLDRLAEGRVLEPAYNLGYGRGATVREVLAVVEAVLGRKLPVEDGPRRPGDPARLIAAAERGRADLGWQPQHDDLREIVESALAWEQRLAASA